MQPNTRIDPQLKWFKPHQAYVGHIGLAGRTSELTLSRGPAYELDALAALRAFAYKVRDVPTAKDFVREYGPLVEPVGGKVSVSDMVKTQREIVSMWKEWRALD